MRKSLSISLAATAALTAPLLAQQSTSSGQDVTSAGITVDDATQIRIEFRDPGNFTAKAVAQANGIPVGEATSRLRAQARAAVMTERLAAQFPDSFAGLTFTNTVPMRVRALFKGDIRPESAVAAAARESGIEQPVETAAAPMSMADQRRFAGQMIASLRSAGRADIWFSIDPESGRVTVGAAEDAVLRDVATRAAAGLPVDVVFDPAATVVETALAIAGEEYNSGDTSSPETWNCTTGFSGTTGTPVATTAGHCANRYAEFNIYTNTTYGSAGGNRLNFVAERKDTGVDIQWLTIGESDDQASGHYWNGSYSTALSGSFKTYPGNGADLCKYGRITRWDCGKVNGYAYNGAYGGPFYIVESTTVSMSEPGDSGGPVVAGSIAYGWIHGYQTTTKRLVYTTIKNVYDNTSFRIFVCAAGTC